MRQSVLLVLVSLVGLHLFAQSGDFEHDTSPVDMRMYWPRPPAGSTLTVTYRRYDGSLYAKRMTKNPNDPMSSWLPISQQPGIHFSREDYIPTYYGPVGGYPPDDPIAYFNNSWSMVLRPDKSVSEIADSWPLWKYCVTWCSSRGQYYGYFATSSSQGDIVHGRPGGHILGENYYYKVNVDVWQTPDLQKKPPTFTEGLQVYSIIRLEQKYNNFTPEYGRAARIWAPGNGKPYPRTVKMVLQHGTRDPSSPEFKCSYYPSGYVHRDGYTSFWQYIWYAEGLGVVKEALLFDERADEHNVPSCRGAAYTPAGVSSVVYEDYIDDPH